MALVPSPTSESKKPTPVADDSTEIVVKPTLQAYPGAEGSFYTVPEADEDDENFEEDFPDYLPRGLLDEGDENSKPTVTLEQKQEDTRGKLAIIYTIATFLMFVLGFVVALIDAIRLNVSIVDELTRILPLLSGIFLGSLGFVLGYYFRKLESEEKKSS